MIRVAAYVYITSKLRKDSENPVYSSANKKHASANKKHNIGCGFHGIYDQRYNPQRIIIMTYLLQTFFTYESMQV